MVRRGFKDAPARNALYIVREDVPGLPIGSTQEAIDAGIAAATAAGYTVSVNGNMIEVDVEVYLADYFNGDIILTAGDLLQDLGKTLVLTSNGREFLRAKLVMKLNGSSTEGNNSNPPFYVTTYEAYGDGGWNGTDVFVKLVF